MVLAKSMFIFLNERSFFTIFAPLTCLVHIPLELLLFGPTGYEISEKIRALACPLFEISTIKVYVHDVGLCTASTISKACDPTFCRSDDHRPSNKPEPLYNDFWDTLYII